jgi:hypothetical protein
MSSEEAGRLQFQMAALKEVQDTTRAYDTKAQIVGVGYIFAINIVLALGSGVGNVPEMGVAVITLAWLIFIMPIVLFGSVLYPTRKVSPKLGAKGSGAAGLFYSKPEQIDDVDQMLAALQASSVAKEIAYEILKTSALRDIKRQRFLRALWAGSTSFALLFMGQLLRVEDGLPF